MRLSVRGRRCIVKGNRIFSILSGLYFILYAFMVLFLYVKDDYIQYLHIFSWIDLAIWFAIGVIFIISGINIGTVILFALSFVGLILDGFVYAIEYHNILYIFSYTAMNLLALIQLLLLAVSCLLVVTKNVNFAKIISVLPVGLYFLRCVINIIRYFHFSLWLVSDLLIFIAYIFMAIYIITIPVKKVEMKDI